MIKEAFGTLLPYLGRVRAITIADFRIAGDHYEVPRGGTFEGETERKKRTVRENAEYI
jgi:hypothetical protein